MRILLVVAVAFAVACGDDDGGTDAGTDSGGTDSSLPDATVPDAGDPDAGEPDASEPDAGCPDDDDDGVCNDEDQCLNGDDTVDGDDDGVADACDVCNGHDDALDDDADMVPDGCDCDTSSDTCDVNATCTEAMTGIECGCNDGYTGDGATCAPVDCGTLDPPTDGTIDVPATTFESVATYSCDTGFSLAGPSMRTCQADGTWSDDPPICSSIDCGGLGAPTNGMVDVPSTGFSSVATYSCDPGYLLVGDATRTCQNDSMWSGSEPTCMFVDCGALGPPIEGMVSTDRTSLGGTATYTCNPGHTLAGSATRMCQPDGSWSGAAPTCPPVDCGALTAPTNGDVIAAATTFGSIASYFCDGGFMMSGGTPDRTCQADGSWSGSAPMCVPEIIDCGAPPSPANGTVSAPDTTAGNFADYACNAGFRQFSGDYAICQADGTWLGSAPTCLPLLTCACDLFAEDERIQAAVNAPGSAVGVVAGQLGTVIAASTTRDLIEWDGWTGGHDGNCSFAACGTCVDLPINQGRWYTTCADLEPYRLTCACGGVWYPGDRVVALVDNPRGARNILRGRQGTVVAGGNAAGTDILIQWDAWTDGHDGNCSFSSCGACVDSGLARWYTDCDEIGRP